MNPSDRILVLAPHPDDEVLGCGGVLQRAAAMGLPRRVVFLTYGDNNARSFAAYRGRPVVTPEAVIGMAEVRRSEAMAADRTLGLSPDRLTFLGYPDFGTLAIWSAHWGAEPAYRGLRTGATAVPYRDAFRPGASYKGEEILHDLKAVLAEFRPTKLFLSHPGDRHPDHLALYLFTRVALWDLADRLRPEIFPYLIHFRPWPQPRGLHRSARLTPPELSEAEIPWVELDLAPGEVERKFAALKQHRSQYGYSAPSLSSFVRRNELFGDFPVLRRAGRRALEEEAAIVGLEIHSVSVEGHDLVLATELSRPMNRLVRSSIQVFGYRRGRAFASLPKLHIEVGRTHVAVYDQDRKLPPARTPVAVVRNSRRTEVRLPLAMLGDPEILLTATRTYLGNLPLNGAPWRVVALEPRAYSAETHLHTRTVRSSD
jgi:LmbE family N-acetylglucosaminyl deacetylase